MLAFNIHDMKKKLKYISIGLIVIGIIGAIYLYKDIEFYKKMYFTFRVENKYETLSKISEKTFDVYISGKPKDAIIALKDFEKLQLECLNFFQKNRQFIFELSHVSEKGIMYDLGLNSAFLAKKYNEIGNKEKYDEHMRQAIKYISVFCSDCTTEKHVLKIVNRIESNRKS
jgi:hypothetical protein